MSGVEDCWASWLVGPWPFPGNIREHRPLCRNGICPRDQRADSLSPKYKNAPWSLQTPTPKLLLFSRTSPADFGAVSQGKTLGLPHPSTLQELSGEINARGSLYPVSRCVSSPPAVPGSTSSSRQVAREFTVSFFVSPAACHVRGLLNARGSPGVGEGRTEG